VLSKVSSAGGNPVPLTTLENPESERAHRWPQILPDGKAVLFTSTAPTMGGSYEDADIEVYSISEKRLKTIQHRGFHGWYVASGDLVYTHEGTLFAVPFDVKRLEVTGQPVPILDGVVSNPTGNGGVQFSFSENGTGFHVIEPPIHGSTLKAWLTRKNCTYFPLTSIHFAACSQETLFQYCFLTGSSPRRSFLGI